MEEQPGAFDPLRDRLQAVLGSEYEVGRRLGAGGMGFVYLAHEAPLKRSVAIKVLRPELATAVAAERFRQEAQLLASVNHPSVVTIHRVYPPDARSDGLPDAELFFFVMELLGGTLEDRLRQGTMSAPDVARVGGQLLEGLALIHEREIVHRDIKPSNIFFQDPGAAKLGDFGIAVLQDPGAPQLTGEGGSPLTVRYAAPEQIAGRKVDRRADLYSLALVCHEALTGSHKRVDQDPADCDWTRVPRRMRRVLLRALATDPADRWPDARAFATALAATQPGKWLRPALAGGLVVAVLAGLIGLLPLLRTPPLIDLVLLPLAVEGGTGGGAISQAIGGLVEQNLRSAFGDSGLSVARMTSLPAGVPADADSAWTLPASTWDSLRTHRVLRGELHVFGDSMELATSLVQRSGDILPVRRIRRAQEDWAEAAWSLAAEVVRLVRDCVGDCFKAPLPLDEATVGAWRALGAAEDAFQRDNWTAAEAFYRQALDLDPQLALARWGLFNVRRWERATGEADVEALAATYAAHEREFGELDRLLITADIAHTVPERLAKYDSAVRLFPYDVYPRLLRGNELFHRGALVGRGVDSAIAALEQATQGRQYASTYSMLTWAYIRHGDSAAAARTLATYKTLASDRPFQSFDLGSVLELAWAMRFLPADVTGGMLQQSYHSADGPASLELAVRMALAFEVPLAQLTIGQFLALQQADTTRTQGLAAQSLALLALGRPDAGFRRLDEAAALSGDAEYAFQALEWQLALPALGVPGIAPARRVAARDAMVRAADGGPFAARARWMLMLDTLAADPAAAGVWLDRLGTATDSAATLHAIGTALLEAARGDTAGAIARSDSLVLHTLVSDLADPWHRVVLYLSRGHWLAARDPAAADVAWRWYENADLVGWPSGPPQAAELDWAFEPFARALRARLAVDHGDRASACAIVPTVARYWEGADTPFAALLTQLRTTAGPCAAP